jgi:hypothetical protein
LKRLPVALVAFLLALAVIACGGASRDFEPLPTLPPPESDDFLVGRPVNRVGIGDVDLIFDRYEATRSDLIALYRSQPWFQDGLSREEALFVERGLTFVARYAGPRRAYVSNETVERKLYKYERVQLASGEMELLLIYEPGHNAERQMSIMTSVIPVLESLVGVEFPERVLTVINGNFEINDFNDGQFIRIANCCTTSAFILAHELAHAYWSMGPSWFNEGMADIYAIMALERLNQESPPGWRPVAANLESHHRSRRAAVDSGRFPDIPLTRRLASDGLYEAADAFLLDLRDVIGDVAFRAAVRDIYLASDFGRFHLREKRIQDTFMGYADENGRDEIMAMFNRQIWGDNGERYRELQELEEG